VKLEMLTNGAKRAAAAVVDALADLGERMPGVSQVTITAAGASVTVTPKPAAAPPPVACPHCGKP